MIFLGMLAMMTPARIGWNYEHFLLGYCH